MPHAVIKRYTSAEDARQIMKENIGYSSGCGSLAKVDLFIEAAMSWLMDTPVRATSGGRGGEEIWMNTEGVKFLLKDAQQFRQALIARNANGGQRFLDFTDYRG